MRLLVIVIVVICVLVIAATMGTVIVGSKSFEGIVVDKPYEAGLAWDEEHKNRERLGWNVTIQNPSFTTGKNDLVVIVTDKNGSPLTNTAMIVSITRPSTREYDRRYEAPLLPGGIYKTGIDLPLYGNWDLDIDIHQGSDRAVFKKVIYAVQEKK
jgi:nitrogen fixation protein FixH